MITPCPYAIRTIDGWKKETLFGENDTDGGSVASFKRRRKTRESKRSGENGQHDRDRKQEK